jgi:hypothetical protein
MHESHLETHDMWYASRAEQQHMTPSMCNTQRDERLETPEDEHRGGENDTCQQAHAHLRSTNSVSAKMAT